MSKHDVANRVIAYRLEGEPNVLCGLAIAAEGENVRVFEYMSVSDPSEHIKAVEKNVADEEKYIASCQEKIADVERNASPAQQGGGMSSDSKLKEKWLQWAKDSLRRVGASEFQHIASTSLSSGSSAVEVICSAVAAIVRGDVRPMSWDAVRDVFSDAELVEKLCRLDEAPMPQRLHEMVVTHFYPSPLFTAQAARGHSPALEALHKWITAYMDFESTQLATVVDLESQQRKDELVKGLAMAQERLAHMREDIDLSRSGMLFRRTNRIKVIPRSSIVKVVEDAPARLGREFVIKGLSNVASGEGLAIVRHTPKHQASPAKPSTLSGTAPSAGASRPERRWRHGSLMSTATTASSDAENSFAKFAEPTTASAAVALSVSATSMNSSERWRSGLPTPRSPHPQTTIVAVSAAPPTPAAPSGDSPREEIETVPPPLTHLPVAAKETPSGADREPPSVAAACGNSATGTPPARDTTPCSAELISENERLRAGNARLQRELEEVRTTHQIHSTQSHTQILSLQDEFLRVLGVHKGLLEDFNSLRTEHEAVLQGVSGLLQAKEQAEDACRLECAKVRRELLLAKVVIALLRGQVAQHAVTISPPTEPAAAALPHHRKRNLSKSVRQLQDTLLCTSEYLRGAIATVELIEPY